MENINWFPGHMAKALREIDKTIKLVDLLIIVIDSRIPLSSMSSDFLKLAERKKTLVLFNKMDLADLNELKEFENLYQNKGFFTLKVNSNTGENINKIYPLIRDKILIDEISKIEKKGLKLDVFKALIVGTPNVGKSSLINRLVSKKATKIENRPGVTRTVSWIRISKDFELVDSPGIMPKRLSDIQKINLSLLGSIKDTILPLDDVVLKGIEILKNKYPDSLKKRYNLIELGSNFETLLEITKNSNYYLKGAEPDFERTYQRFLKDLRSGLLGRICLDDFTSI